MTVKKHILIALVEDKPGVLNRMASIFRRRGFNIESVNVIETIDSESSEIPLTRVAIVVGGSTARLEQVRKQLDKLIDVVNVSDVPTKDTK